MSEHGESEAKPAEPCEAIISLAEPPDHPLSFIHRSVTKRKTPTNLEEGVKRVREFGVGARAPAQTFRLAPQQVICTILQISSMKVNNPFS